MSKKKLYGSGQGRYGPQTYRGKDVTGALSFVKSLMDWDLFPKDDRPETDREAASLFFKIDRSGANLDEFLSFLAEHNEYERQRLRESKRKGPKKAATKSKAEKPRWPEAIVLPPREYDDLRARIEWLEATPKGVEPPVEEADRVVDALQQALDRAHPNTDVYVVSAQIETSKTKTAHTHVRAFVALLENDESLVAGSGEYHCYIKRGKRG